MSARPLHFATIGGDGIGPEVIAKAVAWAQGVLDAQGIEARWTHLDLGADRYLRDGTTLDDATFAFLRDEVDGILLGALGDPRVPSNQHAKDILLGLRFRLDLYVNFRPIVCPSDDVCPLKGKTAADIDMVVFRENTEGLYTGVGGQFKRGTPDEVSIEAELNTRKGVERILRAAFVYADTHGRRSVCMADKANAMRHGHDLWQRAFAEVAAEYPHIRAFHRYVDVLAMEMVSSPETYDVIVTNNLFGDILTDLGAALQGGIGRAASANLHPGKRPGLFEPVHGSAPDLVGTGLADPTAAIESARLMLESVGVEVPG